MKTGHFGLPLFLMVWLMGCAQPSPPAVDVAKEEAAIRAVDAQWLAAAQAKNTEKTVPYWAEDATIFPPDSAPVTGTQAIRAYVGGAFASPDFSIRWKTDKVVVASSGDLAYSTGSDQLSFRTPANQVVTQNNNGVVVWKKTRDGSWKAAIDIWNAQPSTPMPMAGK